MERTSGPRGLRVQVQHGLHLLAPGRQALQWPQHPQRDEVWHGQRAAHGGVADPRHSPGHGVEQVSQDGVIGQAMHQGLETIDQGFITYITVFQQKLRANRQPLVKSFRLSGISVGYNIGSALINRIQEISDAKS